MKIIEVDHPEIRLSNIPVMIVDENRHFRSFEMIKEQRWESFAERLAKLKVAMMFKIQNNIVDIPKLIFTEVGTHNRGSQVVFVPAIRINSYKYSFVLTVSKIWNGLLIGTRNSTSLESFKSERLFNFCASFDRSSLLPMLAKSCLTVCIQVVFGLSCGHFTFLRYHFP